MRFSLNQAVWFFALMLSLALSPAWARTNYVSLSGTHVAPYTNWVTAATNIQAAIDVCAYDGDTVLVNTGTYTVATAVAVDLNVAVVSVGGPRGTVVRRAGPAKHCVFWIASSNAVVEGFTITNGATSNPSRGGGVYCAGGTLRNCIVAGCSGDLGGGVYLAYPPAKAERCVVRNNTAGGGGGGGIYCASGTVVRTCEISGNYGADGGGLVLDSGAAAENCTVAGNWAGFGGGVIASNAALRNCLIYANTATVASSNWLFTGTPSVQYCCSDPALTGVNNVAGDPLFADTPGGDFRLVKASACRNAGTNLAWMAAATDLDGLPRVCEGRSDIGAYEFTGFHYVSASGADIWPYTTLSGAARSIHRAVGAASAGDTVWVDSGIYGVTNQILLDRALAVRGMNGASNTVLQSDGGAHRLFELCHPEALADGLTLSCGYSEASGGAVSITGGGTVRGCIVTNNTAVADGGGVYISTGGGVVSGCYFIGNRAYGAGGGVAACGTGAVVRSCAMTINSAFSGLGGGVYTLGGASVENCTMVGNSGSAGPALYCSGNGALVRNTIAYANNFITYVNWGTNGATTFDHCCSLPLMPGSGNTTNDPQIYHDTQSLGWDFHLRPGSPCLNAGSNQPWMAGELDADGYPRVTGGAVDMGAYERSGDHYYSPGGSHVWPYLSWATAATNVQAALEAGQADDTVWVTNGTHTFAEEVVVAKPLTLSSVNGFGVTAIDGQGGRRCVVLCHSNAAVRGFTLTRGAAATGGAVYSEGGNVLNCLVVSNSAGWGGGGVYIMSEGLVSNCTVKGNQAAYYGAGVYCRLGGRVINSTVMSNGVPSLQGGGGVYCHFGGSVEYCSVIANHAQEGGAVYLEEGGCVRGGCVTNNFTRDQVGAIHIEQDGAVTGARVAGNDGCGVFLHGGGAVSNCVICGNWGDFPGAGGVYVSEAGTVLACEIAGNSGDQAGGVFLDGGGLLSLSTVVNNLAENTCGGVWLKAGGTAFGCTITNNEAVGAVGGVMCESGGVLRNCIVACNRSGNNVGGVAAAAGATVESCTIVGNVALAAIGGVHSLAGAALRDSIMRFNSAPESPEYQDSGAAWSFCNTAPAVAGLGNATNDPALVGLPGGLIGLSARSPCVDAGTNLEWMAGTADIRGAPRVGHGRADIGAYETAWRYVSQGGGHRSPFLSWADASTNIQSALDVAWAGDTVEVSNGLYAVSSPVSVTNSVALRGSGGPSGTVLRRGGGGSYRVVSLLGHDAVLDGFTITNGLSPDIGGGVYTLRNGLVQNCVIEGNAAAGYGGGAFMGGGGGELRNCVLRGNQAQAHDGGGAYLSGGTVMRNCLVATNTAANGGGVFAYQGATVDCCTVAANVGVQGGGIHCYPAGALLQNSVVSLNRAGSGPNWYVNGSAVFRYTCTSPELPGSVGCTDADPRFEDAAGCDFRLLSSSPCVDAGCNEPWMAGASDVEGAPRVLDGTVDMGAFEVTRTHYVSGAGSNRWPFATWGAAAASLQQAVDAAGAGDEVRVAEGSYALAATVNVPRRLTIRSDSGPVTVSGGGERRCFELSGDAVIEGLRVSGGRATVGGGFYISATNSTLRACLIENNQGDSYGGGVFYAGAGGLMEGCEVRNNAAPGNQGGGVYARSGVLLRNCLIHGNTSREGGGLFLCEGGAAESCTVVTNQATWLTGGVRLYNGGTVSNSIVYHNVAPQPLPNVSVHNSGSVAYSCTWPAMAGAGNLSADPGFEGGASFRPVAGSPVVDAGAEAGWMAAAADLDGMPRRIGAAPDMGAYENSPTHYVSLEGEGVWPYLSWNGAARSVGEAAAVARKGDTVAVGVGTYSLKEALVLTQAVRVVGVAGRAATILRGRHAFRCVTLAGGAVVEEFLITGGQADDGGGVYCRNGGTVRACTLAGNGAEKHGGGGCAGPGGLIADCLVSNNVSNCDGGGLSAMEGGLLSGCRVIGNAAVQSGGGVALFKEGAARNCLLAENEAGSLGGGAYLEYAFLDSCTAVENGAHDAGGVFADVGAAVSNSIAQLNFGDLGANVSEADEGSWFCCCTLPLMGTGGIEDEPQFTDPENGDYRLAAGCACIDSGGPGPATDLDGLPRPLDGDGIGLAGWDIGAFEYLNPQADSDGDGMFDGWELAHFGSPTNGVALADDDGDLAVNADEFVADTDPWDAASLFAIVAVSNRPVPAVGVASSAQRVYSLYGSTNLVSGGWSALPPSVGCPGTGGLLFLTDTNALPVRFYRVEVDLP